MTGLGLLNPFHVLYPIPNVACNSRNLCYSTIVQYQFYASDELFSANFGEYLQLNVSTKQNPNETLRKSVRCRNVLGHVKYPCVQHHHNLPTRQIFHLHLQQNNYRTFLLRFCRSKQIQLH